MSVFHECAPCIPLYTRHNTHSWSSTPIRMSCFDCIISSSPRSVQTSTQLSYMSSDNSSPLYRPLPLSLSLPPYLPLSMYLSLPPYLFLYLFLYLPISLSLSPYLFLYLPIALSPYLPLLASFADPSVSVEFVSLVLKRRAVLGFQSSNEGELAAFISYAQAFPKGLLALVDTYDTMQRYGTVWPSIVRLRSRSAYYFSI
jgi:hypothetical protein